MKNLTDRGYSLTVSAERETARDVREKLCYIGVDYDSELKSVDRYTSHVIFLVHIARV